MCSACTGRQEAADPLLEWSQLTHFFFFFFFFFFFCDGLHSVCVRQHQLQHVVKMMCMAGAETCVHVCCCRTGLSATCAHRL
jgi:hypothetical protein